MKMRLFSTPPALLLVGGLLLLFTRGVISAAGPEDGAPALASSNHKARVCIVGGGVSGVTAAHHLAQRTSASVEIVILEGNHRLGGRAWTVKSPFSNVSVDMGAQWLHGPVGHPLKAAADRLSVRTVPDVGPYQYLDPVNGNVMAGSVVDGVYRDFARVMTRVENFYQERGSRDRPLGSVLNAAWRDVAGQLSGPLRNRFSTRAQQLFNWIIRTEVEEQYAGSRRNLSLWWYNDDSELTEGDDLVPIGVGELVRRGFPVPSSRISLRLNYTVNAISLNANRTLTVFSKNAADNTLCSAVIVTVSLGVMKSGSIKFTPGLPTRTRRALSHRQLGHVEKFILEFSSRWWPAANAFYLTKADADVIEVFDHSRVVGKPILVLLVSGEARLALWKNKTDAQVLDILLAGLQQMFPKVIVPRPVFYQAARWVSDPLFRGAWSYNAVGINPSTDFVNIRRSASARLVFAGEHTDRGHFGTLRGAYLSGVRAANSVLGALGL